MEKIFIASCNNFKGDFTMTSDFIKMLSDWRRSMYPQTIKHLVDEKVPCGMFLTNIAEL